MACHFLHYAMASAVQMHLIWLPFMAPISTKPPTVACILKVGLTRLGHRCHLLAGSLFLGLSIDLGTCEGLFWAHAQKEKLCSLSPSSSMHRQLRNADPTRPIFAWEPVPREPACPAPAELVLFGKWSHMGCGSCQDVNELVREPSGRPQGSVWWLGQPQQAVST